MYPPRLAFGVLCVLLAGCAAGPDASTAQNGTPIGYRYYDANHPNGISQASPQAIYNATQGIWLWPPQTVDWP
jgi:hypothetical protein